jgi:hypothetical protein
MPQLGRRRLSPKTELGVLCQHSGIRVGDDIEKIRDVCGSPGEHIADPRDQGRSARQGGDMFKNDLRKLIKRSDC